MLNLNGLKVSWVNAGRAVLPGVMALGLTVSLPLPVLAATVVSEKTATGFKFPESVASGFNGPADLCAFPHDGGLMVVVPDLVKSELRMIQLRN